MKFKELFKVIDADMRLAIDYKLGRYTYGVEELKEDFVFYEEIKDHVVHAVWYSKIYGAIVIELE